METFTAASLRSKRIEPPPLLSANLPMGPSEGLPVHLKNEEWVESRKRGYPLSEGRE